MTKKLKKIINVSYINMKKQSGQALLFVVVAMTIALTVGVALSSRTISSLRSTSTIDTSSRVFSAAEGGIEWFLRQPMEVLINLSDGNNNNGSECPAGTSASTDPSYPGGCTITYEPQVNDTIAANATVTVSEFRVNHTQDGLESYWFSLNPGSVKEVSLSGYSGSIDICFKSLEASQSAALYYITYKPTGIVSKSLITPNQITGTMSVSGDTTADAGKPGTEYDSCQAVVVNFSRIIDDPKEGSFTLPQQGGIRIKTLYAPAKIAIYPSNPQTFPTQGYKITSVGQLSNVSAELTATKQISVYRSLPYAPSSFDYSIYSEGAVD